LIGLGSYFDIAAKALDYRSIRSDLINGNIANIDTPNYKAKDISFEGVLRDSVQNIQNSGAKKLELATTNPMHLKITEFEDGSKEATIFMRPNHAQRNDGNTVDLDVETTQMSKNAIMIEALTEAMKKRASLLKAVIDTSSRVN
jgi:flagellar basal-body rod protein FlgB